MVDGDCGERSQGLFLCVALGAGGLLFLSARARAWLSVTISKHVFEHRYDYRAEWMRFTATLAEPGPETGGGRSNLYSRPAQPLADLTGSPAARPRPPDPLGHFGIAAPDDRKRAGQGKGVAGR